VLNQEAEFDPPKRPPFRVIDVASPDFLFRSRPREVTNYSIFGTHSS
jgi:hypothetical protein